MKVQNEKFKERRGPLLKVNKNEKGSLYLSSTVINHVESKENIPAFTPKIC